MSEEDGSGDWEQGQLEWEEKVKAGLVVAASGFSVVGCAFILLSAFVFARVRLPYWRLVVGLTVADLAFTAAMLVGGISELIGMRLSGNACIIQGFLVEEFLVSANMYILSISIALYFIVVNKWEIKPMAEAGLHAIPWTLATILAIIPLTNLGGIHYSWAGAWCWVGDTPKYARFSSSLIFVWFIIPTLILIYIKVWWTMRREGQADKKKRATLIEIAEGNKERNRTVRSVLLFAAAFFLLYAPSTVNRVWEAFREPWYPLVLWQASWTPLQGFVDCLVYGFTSGIFSDIRRCINRRKSGRKHFMTVGSEEEEVAGLLSSDVSREPTHQTQPINTSRERERPKRTRPFVWSFEPPMEVNQNSNSASVVYRQDL